MNERTRGTHRPLRDGLDLGPHELLELIGALGIRGRLVVVATTVIEDELGVADEVLGGGVEVFFVLFFHGGQVHGFFDDFVVVGHFVAVDRLREGPAGAVVLHVVQQVQQLVVVRPVPRLPRQFVHVGGPAGGFDRGDGHRVDGWRGGGGGEAGFGGGGPFAWGGVHDVGFGEGADFGHDGFFLLEEHAPGFEVADSRHHGALHDGAAFVVFDVAHPARAVQGDFFGEALFFKVADCVVVGVGEEVLDGRSGFDVVFQVRH